MLRLLIDEIRSATMDKIFGKKCHSSFKKSDEAEAVSFYFFVSPQTYALPSPSTMFVSMASQHCIGGGEMKKTSSEEKFIFCQYVLSIAVVDNLLSSTAFSRR